MAKLMLARDYEPRFPITLMAKDFGYALAAASAVNAETPLLSATQDAFERASSRGMGGQNVTALARLFVTAA
jgi:3-hydroxyisobutyrate dehydrogenase